MKKVGFINALCLFLSLLATSAVAMEWSERSHRVFSGDFNGDGIDDIYLKARSNFVLIGVDISVPIPLGSDYKDIVLQQDSQGAYTLIYDPSEAAIEAITWTESSYLIHAGDFNGDGNNDYFIQGDQTGDTSFVVLSNGSNSPIISEQYNDSSIVQSVATVAISDINNDGRDDLVISQTNLVQKIAYANNAGQFPALSNGSLNSSNTFVAATHVNGQVSSGGAATYGFSVKLPQGTNGIQPQLGVGYNSQSGSGMMGMGWGISGLSSITRCGPTIAQDGYSQAEPFSNEERFCLDGQKLVAVNGAYGADGTEYRTELETFQKVVSYGSVGNGPSYFKVWDRAGMIMEFGVTADAKVEAAGKTTVARWAMNKLEDRFGNYYTLAYTENNASGEHYIDRIDYTGNAGAGQTPPYSVRFNYVDRPYDANLVRADQPWGYRDGSVMRTTKVLDQIAAYHNNTPVREYNFDYQHSSVTGRIRLDHFQECGYDLAGSTKSCARPTTLSWQAGGVGFENETLLGIPANHSTAQQPLNLDVNGDGLSDLVWAQGGTWHVAHGNGNGFDAAQNTTVAFGAQSDYAGLAMGIRIGHDNRQGLLAASYDAGLDVLEWAYLTFDSSQPSGALMATLDTTQGQKPIIVDANGDSQEDFIFIKNDPGASAVLYTRNANPWQQGSSIYDTQALTGIHSGNSNEMDFYGALALDYDGDGLGDILAKKYNGTKGRYLIRNTGSGYTRTTTTLPFGDGADGNGIIMDVNADGLGDFVVRVSNSWRIYVNKGGSFDAPINTNITSGGNAATALPADYDGDGILDLLVQHPSNSKWRILLTVHEPQADGTVKPTFAIRDTNHVSKGYIAAVGYNDGLTARRPEDERPLVADPNGDGMLDLVYHDNGSWHVLSHVTDKPDLLMSVTDGFGAATKFAYKPLTDTGVYTPETDAVFPLADTRASVYVVSEVQESNGLSGFNKVSFTYKGAKVHMQGRGFLGFSERTATDEQTNLTTTVSFRQDYPYIGADAETTVSHYDAGTSTTTLLERTIKQWASTSLNVGKNQFAYEDIVTSERFELNGGGAVSAGKVDNDYDVWGNVTQRVATSGSAIASGNVTNVARTVTNNYVVNNNAADWLLGFVTKETVTHSVPGATDKTTVTDFTQYAGTLAQSGQTDYVGSNVWATSDTSQRDAFGNVTETHVSAANAVSRRTDKIGQFVYGQYPQTSANALDHSTTFNYDLRFGRVTSITDANGLTATTSYDAFGRAIKEVDADGTETRVTFAYCPTANCPTSALYSITTMAEHDNLNGQYAQPVTTVYYDMLGREVRSEKTNFDGNPVLVDTEYDALGRVNRVSRPYSPGQTLNWTTYQHDDLGRVIQESRPDGSTLQNAYSVSSTYASKLVSTLQVIKPDTSVTTQVVEQHSNSIGQLAESIDAAGTPTHYLYDAHGYARWTRVNNNNDTIVTAVFDIAGNKASITDPNTGQNTYSYDGLGQLLVQTDALSQTTTHEYDVLGRLKQRTDSDGSTSEVADWTYDQGNKGLGQLSSASSPDFSKNYTYDNLGRLEQTATTIAGRTGDLIMGYTYDEFSRVKTTTYPSGFAVDNTYNPFGYQESIRKNADNGLLWQAREFDALGNLVAEDMGNGLTTLRVYDPKTGLLKNIATGTGSNGSPENTTIQDLEYEWDSTG